MIARLRYAGCLAACILPALLLGACGKRGGPQAMPGMSVQTAAAVSMDAPVILHAFGNTKDRVSVDIVPQVSGRLVETLIADGAVVTNGQALFRIDPSDYAARVRQAKAAAQADRANLQLSRITLERNQPLLEKQLISTEDFDTLRTRVDAAAAQFKADLAALDAAELNLSRCTVTATVAGVCSKRYVDDGNLVAAGQSLLTNIRSYDPMYVELGVSEQYLPQLRRALAAGPVRINVMPRGDTNSYAGTLDFVDNAVNPSTGTILLRGQVPNPDLKIWALQFAQVDIVVDTVSNAVMVPEGAVQYGKQGPYLFVAKDGKADLRIVTPGVRYNNLIQIVNGVAPGEEVIVLGQLMLFPGAPVMDLSKMPPPGAGGAPGGAPGAAAESKPGK